MFSKLFRRKSIPAARPLVAVAHLNLRAQPMQRGEFYEDPLDDILRKEGLGEVVGGGSAMFEDPAFGIQSCDIEIALSVPPDGTLARIVTALNSLGAPKGSELRVAGHPTIPFGTCEGLGVFLNGTDLAPEIYQSSDVNLTLQRLSEALAGFADFRGHWDGPKETSLYFYGSDFQHMHQVAEAYAAHDPLCAKCRFERIA